VGQRVKSEMVARMVGSKGSVRIYGKPSLIVKSKGGGWGVPHIYTMPPKELHFTA
jgi:hypothetical protein